jgi:hypothetical protein
VVRLRTSFLLLAILADGSTSCLLDTGPINVAPTVKIDDLAGPLHRDKSVPVTFSATIHDGNDRIDRLVVAWHIGPDCDSAAKGPEEPSTSDSTSKCNYLIPTSPPDLTSICVLVRVTDPYHASTEASHVFLVEDRAPTAGIERTSPASTTATFPLLSKFAFTAEKSKDPDGDDLTFTWTVTQPDGLGLSANSAKTCPSADNPKLCSFTAQQPGTYRVLVRVEDPSHKGGEDSVSVVVAKDSPPCIQAFKPASLTTIALVPDNKFEVDYVADDVNPYPVASESGTSSGTFTWKFRSGTDGPFQRFRFDNGASVSALSFKEGDLAAISGGKDTIQIRVEYRDHPDLDLSSCSENAERCELNHDGCAQWVTWTVSLIQI